MCGLLYIVSSGHKYLCVIASVPTIKNLTLLKWKDKDGCTQKLKVLQEVCAKWELMGDLIGLSPGQLDAIKTDYDCRGVEVCCRQVFLEWLQHEEGEYCATWQGLCELLEDMELSSIAKKLKEILTR